MARLATSDGTKTIVETTRIFKSERDVKVCPKPVRRALTEQVLRAVKKVKKLEISQMSKSARLQWALIHKNWTIEDWNSIVWSDEIKIYRLNSDGIRYAQSRDLEKNPAGMIEETLKFEGGNVILWHCMS